MLRDKSPSELNEINRATLRGMGVDETTVDQFLASPMLSPADKTIIVESMRQLSSAHSQGIYIAHAAQAPDPSAAFFVRRRAEMIAVYNRRVEPVVGFIDLGDVPVMRTRGNKLVALMPFDQVAWTANNAAIFDGMARSAPRGSSPPSLELWITGKASALTAQELKRRGWQLRQDVRF